MKRLDLLSVIVFVWIGNLLVGCSSGAQNTNNSIAPTVTTTPKETFDPTQAATIEPTPTAIIEPTTTPTVERIKEELSDYSVLINEDFISIKDWDNKVNLVEILGEPLSEDIEILGNGADTHTGSFVKRLKYDGLQMELFSPKQNGENYWIMTMDVSKKGFQTSKGIEVGSTVQDVKDAYPDMSIDNGKKDPNNFTYEINDEMQYKYLHIQVENGLVTGIRIFHLIP